MGVVQTTPHARSAPLPLGGGGDAQSGRERTPTPSPSPAALGFTRVRRFMWPESDKSDFGWGGEPTGNAAALCRNASRTHRRAIRAWLYAIAALLVLMVMVGGTTRLTDSGLSIVEWRPVTGIVPPLSESAWAAEFKQYKTSSEYELVNKGMTLDDFKRIYWWEWVHRLLGRLIGGAFLIPLLVFQFRGWIEPGIKWRLWLIFSLGALQGAIGWWMVVSGLVRRV